MTDATKPEQPFAPDAAARVQAYLDAREELGLRRGDLTDPIAEAKNSGQPWTRLTVADLHEVLRQRAYSKEEAELLADKCAAWRSQAEEYRAKLEAVRAVTSEWHQFAVGDGREIDPNQVAIAGHALAQVLGALDGAGSDSEDGEPA